MKMILESKLHVYAAAKESCSKTMPADFTGNAAQCRGWRLSVIDAVIALRFCLFERWADQGIDMRGKY